MKLNKRSIKNLSSATRLIDENEKKGINGGYTPILPVLTPPIISAFVCDNK